MVVGGGGGGGQTASSIIKHSTLVVAQMPTAPRQRPECWVKGVLGASGRDFRGRLLGDCRACSREISSGDLGCFQQFWRVWVWSWGGVEGC